MHISDECFVRFNVIQVLPVKSLYTRRMSKFVSRATENGLLDKIATDVDWEVQRLAIKTNKQVRFTQRYSAINLSFILQITKKISKKVVIEDRVLTVEDTLGMLMLLGLGFGLGFVALSSEIARNFWLARNKKLEQSSDTYWRRTSSLVDSWIIRENNFVDVRHRSTRGSV